MSHLSSIKCEVKSLSALEKAAKRVGGTFHENKKKFGWYGAQSDCDHSISFPNTNFEVGIIKNNNNVFDLQADFYDPTLRKHCGNEGNLLTQAYNIEQTKETARKQGLNFHEVKCFDQQKQMNYVEVIITA